MPTTKSAKKSLRQDSKRRLRNRTQRSALSTAIKRTRAAIDGGDEEAGAAAYGLAVKKLDQAAAKHLVHKNKAARIKSRLARSLAKAASASAESAE